MPAEGKTDKESTISSSVRSGFSKKATCDLMGSQIGLASPMIHTRLQALGAEGIPGRVANFNAFVGAKAPKWTTMPVSLIPARYLTLDR
jgi:hypothetical protein